MHFKFETEEELVDFFHDSDEFAFFYPSEHSKESFGFKLVVIFMSSFYLGILILAIKVFPESEPFLYWGARIAMCCLTYYVFVNLYFPICIYKAEVFYGAKIVEFRVCRSAILKGANKYEAISSSAYRFRGLFKKYSSQK